MPEQSYREVMSDLKKGNYQPVYFLYGDESYYIDRVSQYIEAHALGEREKAFNQSVFYGMDVTLPSLVSSSRRFPVMAPRQVILVKEAQLLKGLPPRSDDDSPFIDYLQHPSPGTVLVFCYKKDKIDKRTRFAKVLSARAIMMESKKPYADRIPEWVQDFLSERKRPVSPGAVLLIAEYMGANLSAIANELDKLDAILAPGREITEGDVETHIGISREFNVFELQEALGRKDAYKAYRIVYYFASDEKNNPIQLTIASLYSYFSKLLIIRSSGSANPSELAAAAGIRPFFVKNYVAAARNYSVPRLERVIGLLGEYDLRSKGVFGSTAGHGELLKELVFRVLGVPEKSPAAV